MCSVKSRGGVASAGDEGLFGVMERLGSKNTSPGIIRNPARAVTLAPSEYKGA